MYQHKNTETFLKIFCFVFHERKSHIQAFNNMRLNKWWHNFYFWVNFPFKLLETYSYKWIYSDQTNCYGKHAMDAMIWASKTYIYHYKKILYVIFFQIQIVESTEKWQAKFAPHCSDFVCSTEVKALSVLCRMQIIFLYYKETHIKPNVLFVPSPTPLPLLSYKTQQCAFNGL